MNKLIRGLLSGASLATLQLCAVTAARAAGTTVSGGPYSAVTNLPGSNVDYILVTGATITGDLTNEGTVGPGNSYGIDVTNSTIGGAVINAATGVIAGSSNGIIIQTNAAIAGGIQNAGKILVSNTSETRGYASAKAIYYDATSVAKIDNTGTMSVNAKVAGTGGTIAQARAAGVYEYADGGSVRAVNESFTGTGGSISLSAVAAATSAKAQANAYAESAVRQSGFYGTTISQAIDNTGTLSLAASANAGAANSWVRADASAAFVFEQVAQHASGAVDQTITNSGAITLAATASAKGPSRVEASAKAGSALYQSAYRDSGSVIQAIANSGSLSATVAALATATAGNGTSVSASARIENLFEQNANHGAGVNQAITNSGALTIAAKATAIAASETRVKADALLGFVLHQAADSNSGNISQTITNSGSLSATLDAVAVNTAGHETKVKASAEAFGMFSQRAEGDAGAVSQAITNSGSLTIAAKATATGAARTLMAEANVNEVFYQDAYNADAAISQSITNSGDLNLSLAAKGLASGTDTNFRVNAGVDDIFSQYAYGSGSAVATLPVTQSITNSGDITISLAANAARSGVLETRNEVADIYVNDLFNQYASNAAAITQSVTNSGAITIEGKATAVGAGIYVRTFAEAFVEDIFRQSAHPANSATLSIVNSGAINAGMTAAATGPKARAEVRAETLFAQTANDASDNISETLDNSGDVSIAMAALASGGSVRATAHLETAAKQSAHDASQITQSIANSGSLIVNMSANAKGSLSDVTAKAWGTGIWQHASNPGSIDQGITNSGTLGFNFSAKAVNAATTDQARATAKLENAIVQAAHFTGSTTGNLGEISQAITNSGTLSVAMAANAQAGAHGYARATIDNLFLQTAVGADSISQSVTNTNSGVLTVDLSAQVKGTLDNVTAYASGAGFQQKAHGVGSIGQSVSNSGTVGFNIAANAVNAGTTHHAGATALLQFVAAQSAQFISGSVTDSQRGISQTISNSGTVSVALSASAKGGANGNARASAETLFSQHARDAAAVSESLNNTGSILVQDKVSASGDIGEIDANNYMRGFAQQYSDQSNSAAEDRTASLAIVNSGILSTVLSATAVAGGTNKANAQAAEYGGIRQSAYSSDTATETVTNSGSISIVTNATSSGGRVSDAEAQGEDLITQRIGGVANATISAVNAGSILAHNFASAVGTQHAYAFAGASGGYQSIQRGGVDGDVQGTISLTNSGTIDLLASAKAAAGLTADARAHASGFKQHISEFAGTEGFDNSGTITLAAIATVLPGKLGAGVTATTTRLPYVRANAVGLSAKAYGSSGQFNSNGAITTRTNGAPLTLAISNSGTLKVSATANGAALAAANISAIATGLAVAASSKTVNNFSYSSVTGVGRHNRTTRGYGNGVVNGVIDNSGSLLVSASADGGKATANGIVVTANAIGADITNGGLISVAASGATAVAMGIVENGAARVSVRHEQTHYGTSHVYTRAETRSSAYYHGAATTITGDITNSGTISVSATGTGDYIGSGNVEIQFAAPSPESTIKAQAEGISVNAETMSGTILNTGVIDVAASGPAAVANGIHVFASQSGAQYFSSETYKYRGTATGDAWTSVHSTVPFHTAVLDGSVFSGKLTNNGTISVSATGAGAKATGVLIEDAEFDGAFLNTGTIVAVANGDGASAVAVKIDASSLGDGASFQNNGGSIGAVLNGGWGTAIDVSGAPAALALGLNGGSIYGNVVENAAGNAISIGSGNLVLDGLINPSKAKLGSLTVGANGTLTLANNASQGNAAAYVNSYVQNGTLVITGAADGSSGSVHAGNATLAGAAIVNVDLSGAAFGTSTTYKVVFSDAALNGTWSSVKAANATTFFSTSGVYSTNEADITLSRATFDSIGGLTGNEGAVGSVIETLYETYGTSGPLGTLLGALFNLTPQQYADALETLSGIPAGELSSVNQSTAQSFVDAINNHLADVSGGGGDVAALTSTSQMLASNIAPTAVSPAQISDLSGTHVWGGGFQSGNSVDRTASGPAYDSHQSGLMAGVDVPVAPNFLFGVAGSWSTGDIQTEKMEGFGTFTALQGALYARYTADNGLYALGDASYGNFTNRLNRYISIPGFGSGNVHGKFDSTAWGLYGEAGWKFNPSDWATSLTPYAAVSYLDAKSDGYTETGFGAPLTIGASSSKATSTYLGLKLSTDWLLDRATITPRITAAWQHDFTKNAWEMSAAFAAAPTVGFGLNGSDLARDGAFVDGGVTLHIAEQMDVLLDYQGHFTSDRTDNALIARANVRF